MDFDSIAIYLMKEGIPLGKIRFDMLNVSLWIKQDTEIKVSMMNIEADYYVVVGAELKELGLLGRLHVPRTYAIKDEEVS